MDQTHFANIYRDFEYNRERFSGQNICQLGYVLLRLVTEMNKEIEDLKKQVKQYEMANGQ